jgi:hypothetical protein
MNALMGSDSKRLWSLWELMQDFDITDLLHVSKEIGRLVYYLSQDIDKEDRGEDTRKKDVSAMKELKKTVSNLGLKMCDMHIDAIIYSCRNKQKAMTNGDFTRLLQELYNRLRDECRLNYFVSLTASERDLYEPEDPLFGEDVEDMLPSIIEDISEAGKCLGLRRPTAAVFHLMRIMEVGVQKFGEKLGVVDAEKLVWQVILDQINKAISKFSPKDDLTKKYSEISAHLYHVKLAWRNETMHPKVTYTEEEAEGIFRAARSYMRELVGVL